MKKSLIKLSIKHIENAIKTIRGEKIILNADLAELYDVETGHSFKLSNEPKQLGFRPKALKK